MGIISKVSARVLIHLGAVEMAATILICYALAVMEGHVEPWLPTISNCGNRPPEMFIFRYGIVAGGLLLAVEAVALYEAALFSELCLVLGTVAGLCLGVVGVVSDRELDSVHTVFAVIFFVFEDILLALVTFRVLGRVSHFSLGVKALCTAASCLATIGRLVYMSHRLPRDVYEDSSILLPLLEWSDTFAILVFHWTFALDLSSLYIAELEEDDEEKGKVREEKGKESEKQKLPSNLLVQ